MRIARQTDLDGKNRLFVPLSEYSIAAYAVRINYGFRCVPDAVSLPAEPQTWRLRKSIQRRLRQWLGFLKTPGLSAVASRAPAHSRFEGSLRPAPSDMRIPQFCDFRNLN